MSAIRASVARVSGERIDTAAALAVSAALELELRSFVDAGGRSGVVTAVAAILCAAPIAARRRWPAGALIVSSAVAVAQAALGGHLSEANGIIVPPLLLGYAAGAWLPARRGIVATVAAVALFAGLVLTTPTAGSISGAARDVFFVALLFVAPWFIGFLGRESGRRSAAFRELAAQAAAENEERERVAIAEERARIGTELQDIIAHSVSAMIIQAGGARRLMPREPERARDSILQVEQTGREALADLRRLLGMLRHDDDPRALAPQPGLDRLPELVAAMRLEGLSSELSLGGELVDLTPGIHLVGYRVVEATLRTLAAHGGQRAQISVRSDRELLELEIRGDRAIPALEQELASISQRVALYDGRLRAVAHRGDGFVLFATLPLRVGAVA